MSFKCRSCGSNLFPEDQAAQIATLTAERDAARAEVGAFRADVFDRFPLAHTLFELRSAGLTVAVHNDYRLNGEAMTFWLFTTPDGRAIKGEGRTDLEALKQVELALAAAKGGRL